MKTVHGFEGNEIAVENLMPRSKKRRAFDPFFNLTGEERIDKVCELLALGVLRLAEDVGDIAMRFLWKQYLRS